MKTVQPQWKAPEKIRAFTTTRLFGLSTASSSHFDPAFPSHNDHQTVLENRRILCKEGGLPQEPWWLNQVHGNHIVEQKQQGSPPYLPSADGAVTSLAQFPLAILTADCLPILACDQTGERLGAFHAGWKGLAAGIVQKAIIAMNCPKDQLFFWIGPSISQTVYQVGSDVYQIFEQLGYSMEYFSFQRENTWLFDLAACAESILRQEGVSHVWRSPLCTYCHPALFYSYRREHPCGRMASIIWKTT